MVAERYMYAEAGVLRLFISGTQNNSYGPHKT